MYWYYIKIKNILCVGQQSFNIYAICARLAMGVQWWYMYLRIGVGYRGENIHIGLTQRVDDGGLSPVHKMTNNMENLQKEKYCYVFFFLQRLVDWILKIRKTCFNFTIFIVWIISEKFKQFYASKNHFTLISTCIAFEYLVLLKSN